MGYYSEPFIDPTLQLASTEGWSVGKMVADRLTDHVFLALSFRWAAQIPRRLGDVSAPALAADRRAMNRLRSGYEKFYRQWCALGDRAPDVLAEEPYTAEHRKFGAGVTLDAWLPERIEVVEFRQRQDATHANQMGYRKVANRAVAISERELATLRSITHEG